MLRAGAGRSCEPGAGALFEQRAFTADQRLLLQGDPHVRRIAAQSFAEKSRGHHADHGDRVASDYKGGAYDRRIARIDGLPKAMADHDDRRSVWLIVFGREDTSSEGAYSQHGEIIPRDVLGTQGPRGRLTLSAHALRPIAGLESSRLFKLRSL